MHNVDDTQCGLMIMYGPSKSSHTFYKSCLGVFQCPQCTFVERPCSLDANRSKQAFPLPAKGVCATYGSSLVHIACNAKLKVVHHHKAKTVRFIHQGFHDHAKPHPIRSAREPKARRKLQDAVVTTPNPTKNSRKAP